MRHVYAFIDVQCAIHGGEAENCACARLPAACVVGVFKAVTQFELGVLAVAPPATKSGAAGEVAGVDVEARNGAGAAGEVLIIAPQGKVAVDFGEVVVDVADAVAQVKADDNALFVGNLRQALQVKKLGTAIENGGQERHCHILRHGGEDVLLCEGLAVAAVDDLHHLLGVKAAAFHKTGNCVAVGGEVQLVNEDFVACSCGLIESGDALVDVQGGIGADGDLFGFCVNEAGQFCADHIVVEEIVGGCPRPDVDAVGFPILQSTQYGLFRVLRA